jgi:hypothetical protein
MHLIKGHVFYVKKIQNPNKIDAKKNKNLVVYCEIQNGDSGIDIDITENFKKFSYYYDKNIKIHTFVNYINKDYPFFNKITIYINGKDDIYPIEYDVNENFKNKTFKEILIVK